MTGFGKVLIDSSAWTQLFRRDGEPSIVQPVRSLLIDGRAAWCEIVRVELWRGVGSPHDQTPLHSLESELHTLAITPEVWNLTCNFARRCRTRGLPVPTTDLIIFATAKNYDVPLLHRDKHFDFLETV